MFRSINPAKARKGGFKDDFVQEANKHGYLSCWTEALPLTQLLPRHTGAEKIRGAAKLNRSDWNPVQSGLSHAKLVSAIESIKIS